MDGWTLLILRAGAMLTSHGSGQCIKPYTLNPTPHSAVWDDAATGTVLTEVQQCKEILPRVWPHKKPLNSMIRLLASDHLLSVHPAHYCRCSILNSAGMHACNRTHH